MVAVVREQVVTRAQKGVRDLFYDSLDLPLTSERETLQYGASESAARWLEFGSRPVDAGGVAFVVAAVGEFAVAYYYA